MEMTHPSGTLKVEKRNYNAQRRIRTIIARHSSILALKSWRHKK
jgi:hypothetical protein